LSFWIVLKKQDASGKTKWQLMIDYRKLNNKIQDAISKYKRNPHQLGNAQYFSAFDLASFYRILSE